MKTTLIADVNKKGVHPTLYDPRLNFNLLACKTESLTMQNELSTINKHIGYAHVIPNEFKIIISLGIMMKLLYIKGLFGLLY